jgi:hypothetical protein
MTLELTPRKMIADMFSVWLDAGFETANLNLVKQTVAFVRR